MWKSKQLTGLIWGLAVILLCGLSPVFAGDWQVLPGHVPSVVRGLTPNGRVPATNQLRLAIGLPLHNVAALNDLLGRVYDPASPDFHHFLTLAEFTARFGPAESEYAAVRDFARTNGLAVSATYDNRLVLDLTGPAAAVEQALHVTLRTYRHPTEARDFFAPDTEPSVPADLSVADVQGLSNYSRPRPRLHRRPSSVSSARANAGSAPDGSGNYFGNDFRNAYAPGVTLTGTGQELGLFEADGFYASDIAAYAAAAGDGRANIPIQTVLLDGYNGTPTTGTDSGNPEVSLDIEMAMSMAPGLTKIVVYEGNPNEFLQNDILNSMLSGSATVKTLSSSWGWTGGPSRTTATIFTNMAAVGQSFFNAAGDSDAFTTGAGSVNGVDNSSLGNEPSSCPIITTVGGTTLTMSGTGAAYSSETVWNWNYDAKTREYVGSSGGISSYYAIPSWQTNINMAARGGSASFRNIPDVALTADEVFVDYGNGTSAELGGTSCAAPLWAAFMALVNEQAAALGKPPMGFLNPALYSLAAGPGYGACFHDVTTGSNTWPSSPDLFYATNGYDLCTGLGTPNGASLINALAGPLGLGVSPLAGSATGVAGGPFTVVAGTFLLTNAGSAPLTWSLVNPAAWLNISATNGTLAVGGQTTLACSLTAAADTLAVGTYTAGLIYADVTSQVQQNGLFTLQVNQPVAVSPVTGFAATGPAGGAFSVSSQTFTLTNQGLSSLAWRLVNTSSWLSASATGDTLAAGSQATLTVSLTAAANRLPIGDYNASVLITNAAALSASLPFTLQIHQPMAVSPTNGFSAAGAVGGPYNVTAQTYSLVNQSEQSLPWGLASLPSWLSASPVGGTLAGGGQTTLTLSLAAAADDLSAGVYPLAVQVTNATGVAASLPFTLTVGQSIVSNGGFETGSFSDWTLVGQTSVYHGRHSTVYDAVEDAATGYAVVHAGTYGAFLGDNALATLSQTLTTLAGQNYLLSFWLDNPVSGSVQHFLVNWSGATLCDITNPPAFGWTNLQFIVTAVGSASVLQFGAENDPGYFGLDDLTVYPLPPPRFSLAQSAPPSGASFNLTWSAVPNAAYQVQYKTNLWQTDWINLGAPITATSGTLSLSDTNALFISPQRFYRLVEQP
jgi:hypothetical protein